MSWRGFWDRANATADEARDGGRGPRAGKACAQDGKWQRTGSGPGGVSTTRVYIPNLPLGTTAKNVERIFEMHGRVRGVQILAARAGAKHACAIVRFAEAASADAAIAAAAEESRAAPGIEHLMVKQAKHNPKWE